MPGRIERRLAELKVELPPAGAPRGQFVPCVQSGNILYLSGQICSCGGEVRHVGKVGREIAVPEARAGRHARFAVGAGSLPVGVAVEVAAVFEVDAA
jgi:enamine deaminase RidA (YjgF/YER057c/UK114 family)